MGIENCGGITAEGEHTVVSIAKEIYLSRDPLSSLQTLFNDEGECLLDPDVIKCLLQGLRNSTGEDLYRIVFRHIDPQGTRLRLISVTSESASDSLRVPLRSTRSFIVPYS